MARLALVALGLLMIGGTFWWHHVRTTSSLNENTAGAVLALGLRDAGLAARDLREAGWNLSRQSRQRDADVALRGAGVCCCAGLWPIFPPSARLHLLRWSATNSSPCSTGSTNI